MKRVRIPIKAAIDDQPTKFYKISKDNLIENSLWSDNVWFQLRIRNFDLEDALRLDSLEGSFVYEDDLYFMVSDYKAVEIDGREVEPEYLSSEFDFDQLEQFIDFNPSKDIIRKITDLDINWKDLNVDEAAKSLIDDYGLAKVAEDAQEVGLIELQ